MNKDNIIKAFDDFVDERYADSEETLRKEIKQAVNDHLKDRIQLKEDPISVENNEE